jgi:predicted XRE-type DNA-binding protein
MRKIARVIVDNTPATRGSGTVFADIGFSEAEAAELEVKAQLTLQIYHHIKSLGLTRQSGWGCASRMCRSS